MVSRAEKLAGVFKDGTMNSRAFAEHAGVAVGTIARWLLEGLPCLRTRNNVRIVPAEGMAWIQANHANSIAIDRTAVVYFVRRDSDKAIKIGWTSDLIRRVHELQKLHGCICKVAACFEGNKPDELALHKKFADDHIGNEWFRPSDELTALIAKLRKVAA